MQKLNWLLSPLHPGDSHPPVQLPRLNTSFNVCAAHTLNKPKVIRNAHVLAMGAQNVGTSHTYQLLDRRLNLSLFSIPDTFGGSRNHKIGVQWKNYVFVIETTLLLRQRPPRALTIPTFPRFLGKEAIVTLRRDDGCTHRREKYN